MSPHEVITDPEAWLERNAVDCQRYRTRLQPSACALYRLEHPEHCANCDHAADAKPLEKRRLKRPPTMVSAHRPVKVAPEQSMKKEEPPMSTTPKSTARACAACGAAGLKLMGRSLCKSCYQKHHRAGTLEQFALSEKISGSARAKPIQPQPSGPHWPQKKTPEEIAADKLAVKERHSEATLVTLEFAPRDEPLLQALQAWATEERRTPQQQILFILDNIVAERAQPVREEVSRA